MPSVEIWIVMGEDRDCEVATDGMIALDRWKAEFGGEDAATCRVVKLNVITSPPHAPDDDGSDGPAVDVVVPDDAGRIEEVETD